MPAVVLDSRLRGPEVIKRVKKGKNEALRVEIFMRRRPDLPQKQTPGPVRGELLAMPSWTCGIDIRGNQSDWSDVVLRSLNS